VSFNDHEGSTKSYAFTREHEVEAVHADFVPLQREITVGDSDAAVRVVTMHDGATVRLRSTSSDYDPTNRESAYAHVRDCQSRHEIATGLLFVDESGKDMHAMMRTVPTPLIDVPYEKLCPGKAALDKLMQRYR
jgi:2-oxoglutarate/2-oxoacid ferredoxin oxidoreductase subunit beta